MPMNIFVRKHLNCKCVHFHLFYRSRAVSLARPIFLTFSLHIATSFQCEPIIAEPLFPIFKHCIWIELIDAHWMSCPFNIRIDRKLRCSFFCMAKTICSKCSWPNGIQFCETGTLHSYLIYSHFLEVLRWLFLFALYCFRCHYFFHCIPSGQVVCTQWDRFFPFHRLLPFGMPL